MFLKAACFSLVLSGACLAQVAILPWTQLVADRTREQKSSLLLVSLTPRQAPTIPSPTKTVLLLQMDSVSLCDIHWELFSLE